MTYYWIRELHIATVIFTIGFFALRFHWMLHRPQLVSNKWVKNLSVVNDTLLLCAGIALGLLSHQYPFATPWLTAKLLALLLYIVLGSMALKRARSRRQRTIYGILALATVLYIVSVALTRSPVPWLV